MLGVYGNDLFFFLLTLTFDYLQADKNNLKIHQMFSI